MNEKGEKKRTATEGLLWLLRGLAFTCKALQAAQADAAVELSAAFTQAYDVTLKKYHNFVVKGIFSVRAPSSSYTSPAHARDGGAGRDEGVPVPRDVLREARGGPRGRRARAAGPRRRGAQQVARRARRDRHARADLLRGRRAQQGPLSPRPSPAAPLLPRLSCHDSSAICHRPRTARVMHVHQDLRARGPELHARTRGFGGGCARADGHLYISKVCARCNIITTTRARRRAGVVLLPDRGAAKIRARAMRGCVCQFAVRKARLDWQCGCWMCAAYVSTSGTQGRSNDAVRDTMTYMRALVILHPDTDSPLPAVPAARPRLPRCLAASPRRTELTERIAARTRDELKASAVRSARPIRNTPPGEQTLHVSERWLNFVL